MGRASESSRCDPLLGQREGAGRARHRITTRLAQAIHHRKSRSDCDARRQQIVGRGPPAGQSVDVVDRAIHEGPTGVLHTLTSVGELTISSRIVGSR